MTVIPTVGGYVPLRRDAFGLLGDPVGRREGHHLAALSVGVQLACEADWRSDTIEPFGCVAWAGDHKMTWRRARRAFDHLDSVGVGVVESYPFHLGRARLTGREAPTSFLHDRSRADETFVTLSRGGLSSIIAEHHLSWVATALLLLLLLICDHRSGQLAEGEWSKTRLCERYGIGWRRLSAGLSQLSMAGLITYSVNRGGPMRLRLLARSALVVPTAPPPAPQRAERRSIAREAAHASGPADDLARRLLAHHRLCTAPSGSLVCALGEGLVTGIAPEALLERLAARGSLAGATDAMAVLVTRARQVGAELVNARRDAEAKRDAQAAQRARQAEKEEAERRRFEQARGEDRWLAVVLERLPTGGELGLDGRNSRDPVVAAQIHSSCAELVARWTELDPAVLIARWAEQGCETAGIDLVGIPQRALGDGGGAPGTLPQVRAGPTLAERLRNQSS